MDLDDFADYRISVSEDGAQLHIRHYNCRDHFVKSVDFMPPFKEVNIKHLMVEVTIHWQEVHKDDYLNKPTRKN